MEEQKKINELEDQVTVSGFVISEAMGDLKLLMSEIERGKCYINTMILQRLLDINSTLGNYLEVVA